MVFYSAPLKDCILRRAPSPASVKHNGFEGREEGDGATNGHLTESDRKPIPGRGARNRKGTALSSGSPRAGNNKFRMRGRAETLAALVLRGGATELKQVWRGKVLNAASDQSRDSVSNAMRLREPV